MGETRYHKCLRVGLVLSAFVLLFDSGFILPITKQLSDNTIQYVASSGTGVFVSVAPTELNQITAEITAREQELNAREAALTEREIGARDFGGEEVPDYSTYILSTILFVLTVLILLNYALDWIRVHKPVS